MVVIFSVVFDVSFSTLGLLAEPVVLSIARSVFFAIDFTWFRQAHLLVCFFINFGFAGVSFASFPFDARDVADFTVLAVFPVLVICIPFSRYSSSAISRCSVWFCDLSPDDSFRSPRESPPFPTCSA